MAIFFTLLGTLMLGFCAGFIFGAAFGVSSEERRNEEVQRHLQRLRREGVIGPGDYR